jgi:hypothetical protein
LRRDCARIDRSSPLWTGSRREIAVFVVIIAIGITPIIIVVVETTIIAIAWRRLPSIARTSIAAIRVIAIIR